MVLSEIDQNLLERCLAREPRCWEDFSDRFLGLVLHVVNHTAQSRSIRLTQEDREDLAAEVFLAVIKDDLSVLRNFPRESSLATYLTVVARRVVVRELIKRKAPASLGQAVEEALREPASGAGQIEQRISDREEVERLISGLNAPEAEVVRMYHLEGKTYREISDKVGVPENSIGPTLSRARQKMRRAAADSTAVEPTVLAAGLARQLSRRR